MHREILDFLTETIPSRIVDNQSVLVSAKNQCKLLITSRSQLQIAKLQRQPFEITILDIGPEDLKSAIRIFLKHFFQTLVPQLDNTKEEAIQQRLLDKVDGGWLDIMHTLANEYLDLGRYNAAESLEQEVLEARKRNDKTKSTLILESLATYAIAISEQVRWKEGEVLLREVLETLKKAAETRTTRKSQQL